MISADEYKRKIQETDDEYPLVFAHASVKKMLKLLPIANGCNPAGT